MPSNPAPSIVTSRTRWRYDEPPEPGFVLNQDSPLAVGLEAFWPLYGDASTGLDLGLKQKVPLGINGVLGRSANYAGGFGYTNAATTTNFLVNTTVPAVTAAPLTFNIWLAVRTSTEFGATSGLISVMTNTTLASTGDYLELAYDGSNADGFGAHKVILDRSGGSANEASTASTIAAASPSPHMATGVVLSNTSAAVYLDAYGKGTNTSNITPGAWTATSAGCLRQLGGSAATFGALNGLIMWGTVNRVAWTDALIYYAWNPKTRWDLAYRLRQKVYGFGGGATSPPPAGRLSRSASLEGLGGAGQQAFNPSLGG